MTTFNTSVNGNVSPNHIQQLNSVKYRGKVKAGYRKEDVKNEGKQTVHVTA